MTKEKIAVLGGGSFGTVLANIAASNGSSVSLWVRDSENALRINSESSNSQYHPELELSSNIIASDDLKYVIANAQIILIAVPSIIFEDVIERIKSFVDKDAMIISCTKGIKSDPFRSMTDIIYSKIDFANENNVGVLSGPNLAKEIAENKIAGTVIASKNNLLISRVKSLLSSKTFKVFSSNDVQGVELSGALKNVYAIICGIAESLNVGENALGLILTRSMAEMSRFAVAKGANPITFLGLSGMGDLVATCTSNLSRNFQLGVCLGEGLSLEESKNNVGQIAEGLRSLEVLKKEAEKLNISMPLVNSLHNLINKDTSPKILIDDLINNPHEVDVEFTFK